MGRQGGQEDGKGQVGDGDDGGAYGDSLVVSMLRQHATEATKGQHGWRRSLGLSGRDGGRARQPSHTPALQGAGGKPALGRQAPAERTGRLEDQAPTVGGGGARRPRPTAKASGRLRWAAEATKTRACEG